MVSNTSAVSHTVRVYRAADCYLQDLDHGFGALDTSTGAVACTRGLEAGARIEQWFPITPGSHALESYYSTVYSTIANNLPFDDSCLCTSDIDNGAGLSWDATIGASASRTFSSLITFSPLGVQPLSLSITPDAASVASGGTAGYTVTVHNPNAASVALSSLSDVIPATFSYVAGSTTGLTTANPTIGSGNTLTWAGPLTVPGSGDGTLHFSATVGTTTRDVHQLGDRHERRRVHDRAVRTRRCGHGHRRHHPGRREPDAGQHQPAGHGQRDVHRDGDACAARHSPVSA